MLCFKKEEEWTVISQERFGPEEEMGFTHVKYISEYSGKLTFKLAYSGYTYSKRKTVNGAEYYESVRTP
jgi:hypothetical protein